MKICKVDSTMQKVLHLLGLLHFLLKMVVHEKKLLKAE